MKTEVISEASEKAQAAALKTQIDMVKNHGTKFLMRQIESENTSPEYKAACEAELARREEIYKADPKHQSPAPAPVTPPPPVDPQDQGQGEGESEGSGEGEGQQ